MREIRVSDSRKIVVQKTRFRNREVLDVRTYIETPKYTGFTRKGINIPIEYAKDLSQAILEEIAKQDTIDPSKSLKHLDTNLSREL